MIEVDMIDILYLVYFFIYLFSVHRRYRLSALLQALWSIRTEATPHAVITRLVQYPLLLVLCDIGPVDHHAWVYLPGIGFPPQPVTLMSSLGVWRTNAAWRIKYRKSCILWRALSYIKNIRRDIFSGSEVLYVLPWFKSPQFWEFSGGSSYPHPKWYNIPSFPLVLSSTYCSLYAPVNSAYTLFFFRIVSL